MRDTGDGARETACIQCVNRTRLTFVKAAADLAKVLKVGATALCNDSDCDAFRYLCDDAR